MGVHRGLTADQRSRQRRQRLIESALDTIAEHGASHLRVRAISQRAGLNDRYFYENFRDCQELLVATFDAQFDSALTGIAATVAKSPPELRARVRAVVEFVFAFIDADPRRARLLIETQSAQALADRRHAMIGVLTQVMVGQARALLGDAAGTDDTLKLTGLTVVAGLLELAAQWYRREIEVPQADLAEFMTALVVATTDISGTLERQLTHPTALEIDAG